jgi:hypothetical protein
MVIMDQYREALLVAYDFGYKQVSMSLQLAEMLGYQDRSAIHCFIRECDEQQVLAYMLSVVYAGDTSEALRNDALLSWSDAGLAVVGNTRSTTGRPK